MQLWQKCALVLNCYWQPAASYYYTQSALTEPDSGGAHGYILCLKKHPGFIHPGDHRIVGCWYQSAGVCRCGEPVAWFAAVTWFVFPWSRGRSVRIFFFFITRNDIYQSQDFQRAQSLALKCLLRSQDMDIVGSVSAEFAFLHRVPALLMPDPRAAWGY